MAEPPRIRLGSGEAELRVGELPCGLVDDEQR